MTDMKYRIDYIGMFDLDGVQVDKTGNPDAFLPGFAKAKFPDRKLAQDWINQSHRGCSKAGIEARFVPALLDNEAV